MCSIKPEDLDRAIKEVVKNLNGIDDLYPGQQEIIQTLFHSENIFYTSSTNSGKTLPAVIYPDILKYLGGMGYSFPDNPKLLFVTALNSLKLSLVNSVKRIGISCEAVTSDNLLELLNSSTSVLFISPEVLKQAAVTQTLIMHRAMFVLKVVDEAHLGKP